MSILKLEPNRSYEIALKYKSPKESQGLSGLQFQYVLASPANHIVYLPPVAHDEIKALNPEPGEVFSLKKSIGPNGAHCYAVERVQIEAPADLPQPKPMGSAVSISAPKSGPVDSPALTTEESKRIFRQLVAVIDACRAAEAYSNQIDYPVSFGPEDIRAMAISGFIEQSRSRSAA
jgi:hypothetical protein